MECTLTSSRVVVGIVVVVVGGGGVGGLKEIGPIISPPHMRTDLPCMKFNILTWCVLGRVMSATPLTPSAQYSKG